MVKEECLWHQRSRVNWLQSGDLNTSYFHSRANQRNRRNYISKLVLDDGTCVEEEQKVREVLVEYFKDLFTSTNPSNFESILHGIESKVTLTMNVELTREFKVEEVEQALTQMKPMTNPGPDGMPPLFYKSYWKTVGCDVTDATLFVLNLGSMPPHINHIFISLIPKIKNLEKAKDFRPISLCNVVYQII